MYRSLAVKVIENWKRRSGGGLWQHASQWVPGAKRPPNQPQAPHIDESLAQSIA